MLDAAGLTQDVMRPLGARWAAGDLAGAEAMVAGSMFDLAIAGTVEEVLPRLAWLVAEGVTQVNFGPPLGPDPRRAIEILGERVLPELKALADRSST
jgi:5,10-methylenetetrahydromethanopterin reductase